jgi:hypothetical protein
MHEAEKAGVELPLQVRLARAIVNEKCRQISFFLNGEMQCGKVECDDLEGVYLYAKSPDLPKYVAPIWPGRKLASGGQQLP